MDGNLKMLKEVERTLVGELEKSPLFIQLESLRKTIATFENGTPVLNGHTNEDANKSSKEVKIPSSYNATELIWKDKVLYVINKLKKPGFAEVVKELEKLEPNQTHQFLYKRAGVMVSVLKKEDTIGYKKEGKKIKYFIK